MAPLRPSVAPANVVVQRARLRSLASSTRTLAATTSEQSVRYSFHGEATLLVPATGRRIFVDAEDGLDPGRLQYFVERPGLAAVLHARGWLVLHASCVQIGDRAVAFAGRSGAGKSSMAAALALRGHSLLSEEVTPLVIGPELACTLAGPPQVCLDPSAAVALGLAVENLRPVYRGSTKLSVVFQQSRSEQPPIPVACVYILGISRRAQIAPMTQQQAVFELVQSSYFAGSFDRGGLERNLHECAEAAGKLEVRRLSRPRDISKLASIAEMVEIDQSR